MKANRAGPAIDLLAVSWFPLERLCELVSPLKNPKQTDHRLFVCLKLLTASIVLLQAMTLDYRQPSHKQRSDKVTSLTTGCQCEAPTVSWCWRICKTSASICVLWLRCGFRNVHSNRIPHHLTYLVSAHWFRYELEAPARKKKYVYAIHPSIAKHFWAKAKVWKSRDFLPISWWNKFAKAALSILCWASWVWLTISDLPIASWHPVIKTHQRLA